MRKPFYLLLLALVAWLGVPSSVDAAAAKAKGLAKPDTGVVMPAAADATDLAKPAEPVKVPKDKPKRSKKNPNDDKDGDPDDGNAGGGNDDKKLPNDGPAND
jgi:hypothetical protein